MFVLSTVRGCGGAGIIITPYVLFMVGLALSLWWRV
jgi:hypothetical protein